MARRPRIVTIGRGDWIDVLPVVDGKPSFGVLERMVEDALMEQRAREQLVGVRQQSATRIRARDLERPVDQCFRAFELALTS